MLDEPYSRTLYEYLQVKQLERIEQFVREGERIDGAYKFMAAIVAALSGKAEPLDEMRENYLDRARTMSTDAREAAEGEGRNVRALRQWREQGGDRLLAALKGEGWALADPDKVPRNG